MKKVIAFSLWGSDEKYTLGAIKNADLAQVIYPDWICRYYIGRSTPFSIVEELAKRGNTEIFLMSEDGDWTSMFWRFFPASDSTVDVMISRDTDSRLTEREKEAVDVWLQSNAGFHIMRDHPYHATEIMGGMWGAKKGCIPRMQHMCVEYTKDDFWQVDQNFLKEKIYPLVAPTSYVHDPYFAKVPFPSERKPKEFVGQAFNGDDTVFEPEHGEIL
jgi:hypothetical protein